MKHRHISLSEAVARQLQELRDQAEMEGRGEQFIQAVREIMEALKERPLPPAPSAFGCPQYHLPNMRLLVCAAVVAPLIVRFAATEVEKECNGADPRPVYVIQYDLLS